MQTALPWAAPSYVRHRVTVPAAAGATGAPLPQAPISGVGDIRGPFEELSVYASLPPGWDDAWIRLVGRLSDVAVPLDLKQGREMELPGRTLLAPAVPGNNMGILFRVSGRPFDFYELQVYRQATPLGQASFVMVGSPPGAGESGDRTHRPVIDVGARAGQVRPFAVLVAVVGAPLQLITAANPTGGHLFMSSLVWSCDANAASTLEIQSVTPANVPTTIAAYTLPGTGGVVSQTFPQPLRTNAPGDRLCYNLGAGGPHSITAQTFEE